MKATIPFGILWLLTLATEYCMAYEFTVEGEIRVRDFYKGEVAMETNYNFTVEGRDCNSRIRIFGGWYQGTEFSEYGWDGKTSYMRTKFRKDHPVIPIVIPVTNAPVTQADSGQDVVNPVNDATLSLYLTDMPEKRGGIEPVWLAYASQCHYRTRKSGAKVEPVWDMGTEIPGHDRMFTSRWRMSRNYPGLLESMTDFGNDLPPFDADVTNSVYSVVSWTNISGMSLPLVFKVIHQRPAGAPVYAPRVYEGVVHSIRPTCDVTNFFPQNPGSVPTMVNDHRLAKDTEPVHEVDYLSKSETFVQDLDELERTEAYIRAHSRESRGPIQAPITEKEKRR